VAQDVSLELEEAPISVFQKDSAEFEELVPRRFLRSRPKIRASDLEYQCASIQIVVHQPTTRQVQ
jgi:hypothetical protein